MSKHTPGPWHVERDITFVTGPGVFKVYPPADLPIGSRVPIARHVDGADARLVALAPEMLEMLRALADEMESAVCAMTDAKFPTKREEEVLRRARHLITKAEGGQP